ncbi:MAG TPA: transglutaminase-like domain-containing protein, partial [Gemmatimonadaceae bacterium]|nr:transglutaminase-like domain-containing protein [Gemmatimonadaceae bacterium]
LNFRRRESAEKNRKIYTWATSNVPKLKTERFAPDTIVQGMQVSISPLFKWTAIGDWYAPIATSAYAVTPPVEAKMAEVLTGARTLGDSIAAIHKWVSQDIRYVAIELGRGGYVPRSAETVVRTGFGDCKDKAMLFLAAMKKIGVTGYPVLLNINGSVNKDAPSLSRFNHMIAAINVGNATQYTDLTAGTFPLGQLPRSEQGSLAVIVKEKNGEQITLPKSTESGTAEETLITGTLGEDGNFSGNVENNWTGDYAPGIRMLFQTAPDSSRRKLVGRALAGQFLERPETDSLVAFDGKDLRSQAKVTTHVSKAKMISKAGELSLLANPVHPPPSYPGLADLLDGMKDRKLPFDAKFFAPLSKNHVDVRIKLPMGWTATLPPDIRLDGPVGVYVVTYSQKGNELHIEKTSSGSGAVIPASRKPEIVDFLRKASADDGKLIPIKAPIHSVASR